MKMFILAFMLLGVTYGYSQEKARPQLKTAKLQAVSTEQKTGYQVVGVVHVADANACGTWIEVQQGSKVVRLNPVNLPESFNVDGKRIKFDYGVTGNKSANVCAGNSSVFIENVSIAKLYRH
jgi:hypothetical protein